jgi:hypothetical protein
MIYLNYGIQFNLIEILIFIHIILKNIKILMYLNLLYKLPR